MLVLLGDVGDMADVQRGELGDHRHPRVAHHGRPLGEVTATAAAIGDHLELGAGSYLVQLGERSTPSRSCS